ncbi:MAG: 6-phosphogluconolactonase [bacterium]
MEIEVLPDAEAVALRAAQLIAVAAREAVAARGRFSMAVSGGHTPWQMLRLLAHEDVPWPGVDVFQVDERIAPDSDPDRNLTHLRESLLANAPLPAAQLHAMDVNAADAVAAAQRYAAELAAVCGEPPVLDLVHLGLGPDGHTASLVPGDAVLGVHAADVALTAGMYQNRRRMTLTYPLINRARQILWVVTGAEKVDALHKLRAGDSSIPGGRVRPERAIVLADRPAAGATA